ncbi:MAG TPA: STAS domain-containing protein [Bryobacteraceae bacterium]|nr:STAS domain-containing protein [Bryobacteraceae bacterium]
MPEHPVPFPIGGSIDIYNAGQLRSTLEEHIQSQEEVIVDLAETDSVDVVGLQLLYSARKTAAKSGKVFTVINVPACLVGLQKTLGLPEDLWAKPASE